MNDHIYKFLMEPDHSIDVHHSFVDLWDTPSTYIGTSNYVVIVTPTESGVQFANKLSNIGFDTTVSGIDPTEDYHLTTRGSVHADIEDSMFYSFRFAGTYSNEYVQHTQSTWATVGAMIFMGQDVFTIESFSIIAWLGADTLTGYVRVYDFTNNNEIAQITISGSGPGALDKYMYTTNDLSNLPDDAAIFEFQLRVEGTGSKTIRMSYASLQ